MSVVSDLPGVEWPVAAIPTPDEPTIPNAVLLPLRWTIHGTLRLLVVGWRETDVATAWLVADDVTGLLEVGDTGLTTSLGEREETWRDSGGELRAAWRLEDAVRFARDFPTHQTAGFLDWLQETLSMVLAPEVLDAAIKPDTFLEACTVAAAAVHLTEHGIPMTRPRLFEHLAALGWASRNSVGHHAPTDIALRRGWLTMRMVKLPAGQGIYEQLHIPPLGLLELRRLLAAVTPLAPMLPVFDDESEP